MPELKPCPFCGGQAFFDKMYVVNEDEYCIACSQCDCVFTISWLSPDKDDLAEAWNRRANDEAHNH